VLIVICVSRAGEGPYPGAMISRNTGSGCVGQRPPTRVVTTKGWCVSISPRFHLSAADRAADSGRDDSEGGDTSDKTGTCNACCRWHELPVLRAPAAHNHVETILRSVPIRNRMGDIRQSGSPGHASVATQAILVMDTNTGKIIKKYTDPLIASPDDVDVAKDGSIYFTDMHTATWPDRARRQGLRR